MTSTFKLKILTVSIILLVFCPFIIKKAKSNFPDLALPQKLAGRILLQVESLGEAWYINPSNLKKYYLGRPSDAFEIMRILGIGITNNDLKKIPLALNSDSTNIDNDKDGLSNDLEIALGTNPNDSDTDHDGYQDKIEIENNYNPLNNDILNLDLNFAKINTGKIFLQTENKGQSWYINPINNKRYFLNRPSDAFNIMRELGLGITNENLNQINSNYLIPTKNISGEKKATSTKPTTDEKLFEEEKISEEEVIFQAASAILKNDPEKAIQYFTPNMETPVRYTLNFLNEEGRFTLANGMYGTKLIYSNDTKKTYSSHLYFSLGGYMVQVDYHAEKQPNGKWLMIDLGEGIPTLEEKNI